MAFKLPPEKSGWLGPEEHFTDTGDISDEPTYHPAVKSSHTRLEYRQAEPEKRTYVREDVNFNHNQRQYHEGGIFLKPAPKTEQYVVGYVADKDNMSPRGFVSYPVDAADAVRHDGSVVPNDKHRDAFVYQTSTPVDYEKHDVLPTPPPAPKVDVTMSEKVKMLIRGVRNQKHREREKTTTCFGNRGESEGSYYYILAPKKREEQMREPMAIIDVDRYKRYENDVPVSRVEPVLSPNNEQTAGQNRVTFDGNKIGTKSKKTFQSILKKPVEHLPHTRYPKLSSFSPRKTGDHSVPPGTERRPQTIDDGQVFSSHSVRFSKDVAVNRAEVQTSSAFVQGPREPNPKESRGRSVAVRTSSRSTSPKASWKSPSRGRSRERIHAPYQFTAKATEPARNSGLFTIDEEVHASYDDARIPVDKGARSDLSSAAKRVIVGRVSPPSRSHGMDVSRQTSESALSTSLKKRKRREHRDPDRKSVIEEDFHENVTPEHDEPTEQVSSKSDWTGLNTYQARSDKFDSSTNRLDLVNPDISAIRQTRVHKAFESSPTIYATTSKEEIGCHNVSCDARQASQEADCHDGVETPRQSGRLARPVSAKKEESSCELPLNVIYKRLPTIMKKCQTDSANPATANSRPEKKVSFHCDVGVGTHFENRASDTSRRRSAHGAYDDDQRVVDDDIPTIDELNARFYTPAAVLPNPGGKDPRFHDQPPEKPLHQNKDTQTAFRSSLAGPQPMGKSQKFVNIVGPSSKVRNSFGRQGGCRPQFYDSPSRQGGVRRGFDDSLPYEHVYSDSVRVVPDFQGQHLSNRNMHGQNLNVNHCGAYHNIFQNHGNRNFHENPQEWGGQDDYRDYEDYDSPDGYNPDEFDNPDGYSPDEYGDLDGYSPDDFDSPDAHENGGEFPTPAFAGQANNDQVVEGAWDFMKNLFGKKKYRNAAYNKRAEVSCGDCGNGMRFTLSVGMQDGAGCLVCYNRIRDDFTELLNVYKEKGYLPCDCKKALCVTELVNGYMAQEKVICTCVGDAFIDLGK